MGGFAAARGVFVEGFALVTAVGVGVGVAKGGEAHGHELDEEEDEDCHEGYAFDPVVLGYGPCEARVGEGRVGGGEEVDEGCGYDDAGAEVFGDEEGPFWNADAAVSAGVDRECGAYQAGWSVSQ